MVRIWEKSIKISGSDTFSSACETLLSYSRYRQYRQGVEREREIVRKRPVEGGGEVRLIYEFRVSKDVQNIVDHTVQQDLSSVLYILTSPKSGWVNNFHPPPTGVHSHRFTQMERGETQSL